MAIFFFQKIYALIVKQSIRVTSALATDYFS